MNTSAFIDRLDQRKLADNTIRTYSSVIHNIPEDADPITWLHERLRTAPIGTVLPFRAAVGHYLASIGMSPAEIAILLPPAKGAPGHTRAALGPRQLTAYHAAVDALRPGSIRTLLSILPRTGLRVSEACTLRWDARETRGDRDGFRIVGKRQIERFVPLTPKTAAIMDAWRASCPRQGAWVFPGYGGRPLDTSGVRHACIRIRSTYAKQTGSNDLANLTPHVLRHTFCTAAIKVMDVKELQALVGHKSLTTTARYLHPTIAEIATALDRLDETL
jgi:integrase